MPFNSGGAQTMKMFQRLIPMLLATLLCGCGGQKESPRDAAQRFFNLCSERKFDAAYEQGSAPFKLTRTAKYFEARARDLGLDTAKRVEWGEPEPNGKAMKLRGEFTLKDGGKLALNLTFLEEDGHWRLLDAKTDPAPQTGAVDEVFTVTSRSKDSVIIRATEVLEPIALAVPSESQLQRLAEDTLLLFNDAIQNGGDFSALYADASDRWKFRGKDPRDLSYRGSDPRRTGAGDPFNEENRLTTAALHRAFDAAVQAKIDISPLKGTKMILSEPARINSDGVLRLMGTFDCVVTQGGETRLPRKLDFLLEYVFESSRWKLFGITVNLLVPKVTGAR